MRAILKAQINKTDRNDARGIAQTPQLTGDKSLVAKCSKICGN